MIIEPPLPDHGDGWRYEIRRNCGQRDEHSHPSRNRRFCIAVAELPEIVEAWLKEHYCHVKPMLDGELRSSFRQGQ